MIKEAIRVKKILSVCLALILLVCIPMQAFAEGTPTFAAGSAEASPGDTIEIPVLVENNPGIIALAVNISFDSNVLTLQEASASTSVFPQDRITFGGSYDTDSFNILWEDGASDENYTVNGTLAVLTFLVNEDAPTGESVITVSYTASSVLDYDLNEVAFTTRNGSVTVVPTEVGGWSFAEGSELYTFDAENSDYRFVCGLNVYDPVITDEVVTTGGWSYEVVPNEFELESTGAKLVIYDENKNVVEEYYAVLFGDINGDATFDLTDMSLMADAMGYTLDKDLAWADFELPDQFPESFAADPNHDLTLDLTDPGMLLDHMGGLEEIDQSPWF